MENKCINCKSYVHGPITSWCKASGKHYPQSNSNKKFDCIYYIKKWWKIFN